MEIFLLSKGWWSCICINCRVLALLCCEKHKGSAINPDVCSLFCRSSENKEFILNSEHHQGLGCNRQAAAIGRFFSSLNQWEASIFFSERIVVSYFNIKIPRSALA